jgi:hypothetical protein
VFEPGRKVFTFRGEEFDIQELVTGVEAVKKAVVERLPVVLAAVHKAVAADDPAAGKSEQHQPTVPAAGSLLNGKALTDREFPLGIPTR